MTSLAALQSQLQAHLLDGNEAIASALRPGGVGIARRLAIYRDSYRLRLLAAMKDSFGHTLQWLGDALFDEQALAYIDSHPSTRSSLNDYGAAFPDWLQQHQADQPEQAELARLDWALRRAFDGPDSPVLQRDDVAALPPEAWAHIGFELVPTWALLAQRCNTLALWLALDRDEDPPHAQRLEAEQTVIVWRKGHQPHFRSITADELGALQQVSAGARFADLCATLAAQGGDADAVASAGRWLHAWLDEQLLCRMTGDTGR